MFRKLQVCEKTISLERQKGKWLRRGWFILTAPPPSVYSPNANINIFIAAARVTGSTEEAMANLLYTLFYLLFPPRNYP